MNADVQKIFQSISDGIVIVDQRKNILFINEPAVLLLDDKDNFLSSLDAQLAGKATLPVSWEQDFSNGAKGEVVCLKCPADNLLVLLRPDSAKDASNPNLLHAIEFFGEDLGHPLSDLIGSLTILIRYMDHGSVPPEGASTLLRGCKGSAENLVAVLNKLKALTFLSSCEARTLDDRIELPVAIRGQRNILSVKVRRRFHWDDEISLSS